MELLGVCSSKMGRIDLAYDFFKQALELDAEKYNSLIGMGAISLERGEV
jgi:Tfp pilus assembly protein PilF